MNGNPITVSSSGFLAATFCHEIDHAYEVVLEGG
jgi:peptide deformylase